MRHLKWTIPAGLLFGLLLVVGDQYVIGRRELKLANANADSALAFGARQAGKADSAQRRLEAALARAQRDSAAAAVARRRFAEAAASAPDTCDILVTLADAAFQEQDSLLADTQSALAASQDRAQALQIDRDSTRHALTALRAATSRPAAVVPISVTLARPSLLSRIIPRPGLGITAGVDHLGRPTVAAGVTFGWRL